MNLLILTALALGADAAPADAWPGFRGDGSGVTTARDLPLHWSASGLPVGVQFAAPFGDEATLLRLGSQLEAARPWVDRRPPRH